MLESFNFSDHDPEHLADLLSKLSVLVDKALDYADLYSSPNDLLMVKKRVPFSVTNNEIIRRYICDEKGIEYHSGDPDLEVIVSTEVLDRRPESYASRETITLVDLTGTKISTNEPITEELVLCSEGVAYIAGYQWEREEDGKTTIETICGEKPADTNIIQKFIDVLDQVYNQDPQSEADAQFDRQLSTEDANSFENYQLGRIWFREELKN